MTKERGLSSDLCIVGTGYVGSSLSAILAEQGFTVRGIDIDPEQVEEINGGNCPIEENTITELFEEGVSDGTITATTSYEAFEDCSVAIVTVGTPLEATKPDTSAVESAASSLGEYLTKGDIVIFRSTLPAGATEETLRPILDERSGLTAGEDYSLAFCPERMAEGSAYADLTSLPVVVGGYSEFCQSCVEQFWNQIGNEIVGVSSPTAAELAKLADNWWIDLNIALANEVALLSEELGVDAFEVIHAANTLPKGEQYVNILRPGAGVGGSCLIKDPEFVVNLGEQHGLDLQTPRVSRRVNEQMPDHVVNLVNQGLSDVEESTIAVLGYSFKAGTDDTRNTPAVDIINRLRESGATVRVTDPFVPADKIESEVGLAPSRLPEALDGAEGVVVVTGHEQYQSLSVSTLTKYSGSSDLVIVDGRAVFDPDEFKGTTTTYLGVGRGESR